MMLSTCENRESTRREPQALGRLHADVPSSRVVVVWCAASALASMNKLSAGL